MSAAKLGPWSGTYRPDYSLRVYKNGDPSKPLTGVDLRSVTTIRTNKSIDNVAGTFSITLKDRRAQVLIEPMDVIKIDLKGHEQGWATSLVGVVDGPEDDGDAEVTSSQTDVTITGRCTAKYLQINSLFLPVWDPQANLPTALIFGLGDASHKLGTSVQAHTPRAIFGYVFDHFVIGLRNRVGLSGTPNARFWLNRTRRFEYVKDGKGHIFQVPYIQFDENTADSVLTQLEVQGFTEAWVDEVGNVVYRRPAWDAPISWDVSTLGLRSWNLPTSDDSLATYVEVMPAGIVGLPSGIEQAMLAGRAPLPSDYVTGLHDSGFQAVATPEFIIDTDSHGQVTSKGAQNWYYQRQKKYGLRPYQISSPLLVSRDQAQAQAEGLLRFMLRWDKSGTLTIPGEPNVRIGQTIRLRGPLDDISIDRTYYINGIQNEYVEGDHYVTILTLTHGRDPGDPRWQQMILPNSPIQELVDHGGVITPTSPTSAAGGSVVAIATTTVGTNNFSYSETRPMPSSITDNPCVTDCSGWFTLCYKAAGLPDPNGLNYNGQGFTGTLEQNGKPTDTPQPGDAVFWTGPDHVAMYVGGGQCIEFGGPPSPVKISVSAEGAYHSGFLGYRTYS